MFIHYITSFSWSAILKSFAAHMECKLKQMLRAEPHTHKHAGLKFILHQSHALLFL